MDQYDSLASDYHWLYSDEVLSGERFFEAHRELLESLEPGAVMLDAACGIGNHVLALARRGFRVQGSDLSEGMFSQAKERAGAEGLEVPFAVCSWEDLSGQFDERFFLLYEDVDLCVRAKKSGYELKLCPSSKIYHKRGFSQKEGTLRLYYISRNRLLLLKKHCTPGKLFLYSFYITLRTLAAFFIYVVKGDFKLAKAIINGYCDGLFKM